MRIITISREFGSGGREIGKRIADILGFAYYDKEIISRVAKIGNFHEKYVEEAGEKGYSAGYTLTYGRTFFYPSSSWDNSSRILIAEQKALKEIAQKGEDCIIVGRCADVVLKDFNPFNIFVHADMDSKVRRCMERAGEEIKEKELKRRIKRIDKNRAKHREVLSPVKWGNKEAYHICINTTDVTPKEIAPAVAQYALSYFGEIK